MNPSQRKALELLRMSDSAFMDLDSASASQMGSRLCEALAPDPARPAPPPEGFVALGAPRKTRFDGQDGRWPVLIAYQYSSLRAWEADFKRNMSLIATDLRSGESFLSFPYMLEGGRRRVPLPESSRAGPAPQGLSASARLTDVDLLDLRTAMPTATRESRRFALTVVYLDWPSNVVVSESGDAAPRAANTTIRRSPFVKAHAAGTDNVRTSLTFPNRIERSRALDVSGVLEATEGDIPVLADGQGGYVSPITLLFLKLDEKDPPMLRAQVPVRVREGRIHGSFSLSVDSALPHADLEGSYWVYLIAGVQIAGPYPLTLLP